MPNPPPPYIQTADKRVKQYATILEATGYCNTDEDFEMWKRARDSFNHWQAQRKTKAQAQSKAQAQTPALALASGTKAKPPEVVTKKCEVLIICFFPQ